MKGEKCGLTMLVLGKSISAYLASQGSKSLFLLIVLVWLLRTGVT